MKNVRIYAIFFISFPASLSFAMSESEITDPWRQSEPLKQKLSNAKGAASVYYDTTFRDDSPKKERYSPKRLLKYSTSDVVIPGASPTVIPHAAPTFVLQDISNDDELVIDPGITDQEPVVAPTILRVASPHNEAVMIVPQDEIPVATVIAQPLRRTSWIDNNPKKVGLAAFGAVDLLSAVVLYRHNQEFREYFDSKASAGKQFLIRSVAVPALMKVEQVKDEGISRKDVLKLALAFATCYGIKKVADALHLWHALKTGDLSKTTEACKNFFRMVMNHKKKIMAAGALSGFGLFIWKASKAVNNSMSTSLIDDFFMSLTNEQRTAIISSPELGYLMSQSTENPAPLQGHKAFMELLTEEQKQKLHNAVTDYIQKNDPLSLLDDELLN